MMELGVERMGEMSGMCERAGVCARKEGERSNERVCHY